MKNYERIRSSIIYTFTGNEGKIQRFVDAKFIFISGYVSYQTRVKEKNVINFDHKNAFERIYFPFEMAFSVHWWKRATSYIFY